MIRFPTIILVASIITAAGAVQSHAALSPPPPATDLTAKAGYGAVLLEWTFPKGGSSGYTVYCALQPGGPFAVIYNGQSPTASAAADRGRFIDDGMGFENPDGTSGLESRRKYYFEVTVSNAGGESTYSNVAAAQPLLGADVPAALRAEAGDVHVDLCWESCDGQMGYNIYRSGGGDDNVLLAKVYTSIYTDAHVANGHKYVYYVTAVNPGGESLPSPMATAIPEPTKFSKSEVIRVAARFCSAIGEPVDAAATAVYPAPMISAVTTENYFCPAWEVTFANEAEVHVVDGANLVTSYLNLARDPNSVPEGLAVPKSKALLMNRTVLSACHVDTSQLAEADATLNGGGDPSTQSGHEWDITGNRMFHRIPFADQFAEITLQAETGQVNDFSLHFAAPQPAGDIRKITKSQAVRIALAGLRGLGQYDLALTGERLTVVQADTFFTEIGRYRIIPGATYVVWECMFCSKQEVITTVWVNAENGSLVGGDAMTVG